MIFLRNLFSMTAMRIVSAGLTFTLMLAFSRFAGIAQLGQFSLLITLFIFFQLLPLLGLHLYLIREISASLAHMSHHLPNAMLVAFSVSILLALLLGFGGTAIYADLPEIHPALWLVALSLLPTAPIVVIEAGLLAQQRMNLVARRNIIENMVRTSLALLLVFTGHGLTSVFIVFLCCRLLTAFSYIHFDHLPSLIARNEISATTLRRYVHNIPVFFAITLFAALSTRLDMLVMAKLSTPEQLGLYAAAYKLYEFGLMVPQIISVVIYPKMSAIHAITPDAIPRLLVPAIWYPILCAAPLLIVLGFNSEFILSLFGAQAIAAAPVLMILLPALISTGVSQLLGIVMLVLGRSDLDLRTLIAATIGTAMLLVLTIPLWGAIGVSIVILFMSVITLALRSLLLVSLIPIAAILKTLFKTLIPPVLMILMMMFFKNINPFIEIVSGIVIYLIGAKLLGLLTLAPIRAISTLMKSDNPKT